MEIQVPLGAAAAPPCPGCPDGNAVIGHAHQPCVISRPGFQLRPGPFPVSCLQFRMGHIVGQGPLLPDAPLFFHEEPFLHNPVLAFFYEIHHRLAGDSPRHPGTHAPVCLDFKPKGDASGIQHLHRYVPFLIPAAPADFHFAYHINASLLSTIRPRHTPHQRLCSTLKAPLQHTGRAFLTHRQHPYSTSEKCGLKRLNIFSPTRNTTVVTPQ